MRDRYSIDGLADYFIEAYELRLDENGCCRNNYKQAIRRALERLNINDSYIEDKDPLTNRNRKYYREWQLERIEAEPIFQDYLLNNSSNAAIRSGKRSSQIDKEIEDRHNALVDELIHYCDELPNSDIPDIEEWRRRDADVDQIMDRMMTKAVFEVFFTPIDREKLAQDMAIMRKWNELDISPRDIRAEERLANPEGHYYKRREKAEPKDA